MRHTGELCRALAGSRSLGFQARIFLFLTWTQPSLSLHPLRVSLFAEGISTKMFLRGRPITMYIPSAFPNYEDLRMELPAEKLQLDWVYPLRKGSTPSSAFLRAQEALLIPIPLNHPSSNSISLPDGRFQSHLRQ